MNNFKRLMKDLKALHKDARRYRWMRKHSWTSEQLEQQCDEAMKGEKPGNKRGE